MRGHPRSQAATLLLALVTLGLWAAWYYFIAFREVDRQNGRRHNPLFFLGFIPVVGLVFGLLYLADEMKGLTADRAKLGLPPGAGVTSLVLWNTLGLLILVGPFIALSQVMEDVNGYWFETYRRHGLPAPKLTL